MLLCFVVHEVVRSTRVRVGPPYCSHHHTSGRAVPRTVLRALQAQNAHYSEGEMVHKLVAMTAIVGTNEALLLTLQYNLQAIPTSSPACQPYLTNTPICSCSHRLELHSRKGTSRSWIASKSCFPSHPPTICSKSHHHPLASFQSTFTACDIALIAISSSRICIYICICFILPAS